MATNRFLCEICNKVFQKEQNLQPLQLHIRGHNLPWKLKQRTNKEVRTKVYMCPEPTPLKPRLPYPSKTHFTHPPIWIFRRLILASSLFD
ncbi:hypothetical protein ACE6H2_016538 [Prunus campanulata]